jgi:hypothetical protein
MFQFPGFASRPYGFRTGYRISGGLPHSETHGSKPARGSPWLFAACCVLRRLSVPRHPPDALVSLDLGVAPRAGTDPHAAASPRSKMHPAGVMLALTPCRGAGRARPPAVLGHFACFLFTMSKDPGTPRRACRFQCRRRHRRRYRSVGRDAWAAAPQASEPACHFP